MVLDEPELIFVHAARTTQRPHRSGMAGRDWRNVSSRAKHQSALMSIAFHPEQSEVRPGGV